MEERKREREEAKPKDGDEPTKCRRTDARHDTVKDERKRRQWDSEAHRRLFASCFSSCYEILRDKPDHDLCEEDFGWSSDSETVVKHFMQCGCGVAMRLDKTKLFSELQSEFPLRSLKELCAIQLMTVFQDKEEDEEEEKRQFTLWQERLPTDLTEYLLKKGVVHAHYDWRSLLEERCLAQRLQSLLSEVQMPSESEDDFQAFHLSHVDGGRPLKGEAGQENFYMVDPYKNEPVSVQELDAAMKHTLHPALLSKTGQQGADVAWLEERWSKYDRRPDLFEDLTSAEAELEQLEGEEQETEEEEEEEEKEENEEEQGEAGVKPTSKKGNRQEDTTDKEAEEAEEKEKEEEKKKEWSPLHRGVRMMVALMRKAGLKRLTWMVLYNDNIPYANPYPVYLFGVSPRTGNLVGVQSTVSLPAELWFRFRPKRVDKGSTDVPFLFFILLGGKSLL
ncbi:Liver stage antigen 3 [Balamuthia mandrillaris]